MKYFILVFFIILILLTVIENILVTTIETLTSINLNKKLVNSTEEDNIILDCDSCKNKFKANGGCSMERDDDPNLYLPDGCEDCSGEALELCQEQHKERLNDDMERMNEQKNDSINELDSWIE